MSLSRSRSVWLSLLLLLLTSRVDVCLGGAQGAIDSLEVYFEIREDASVFVRYILEPRVTAGFLESLDSPIGLKDLGEVVGLTVFTGPTLTTLTQRNDQQFRMVSRNDFPNYEWARVDLNLASVNSIFVVMEYTLEDFLCRSSPEETEKLMVQAKFVTYWAELLQETKALYSISLGNSTFDGFPFVTPPTTQGSSSLPSSFSILYAGGDITRCSPFLFEFTSNITRIVAPSAPVCPSNTIESFSSVCTFNDFPDDDDDFGLNDVEAGLVVGVAMFFIVMMCGLYWNRNSIDNSDDQVVITLPGGNDIILSPTDDEEAVVAVVDESTDALDSLMEVTRINVAIDEYYPAEEDASAHEDSGEGEQQEEDLRSETANENVDSQNEIETRDDPVKKNPSL